MNFEKIRKIKFLPQVILAVMIIVQLIYIIYNFAYLKQDYHLDEPWSFGLANSYYEPYIYQDADETHYTHNGKWFSSEELKNYLTVEPENRFDYKSVFYNQTKDLHPPFYYLILHTVCSFFPGSFSFWYGFAINIVVFVCLQFFLFRLAREVLNSSKLALMTCFLFGFSSGALNMFVFVRMYALLTLIATVSAYYHCLLYKNNKLKKYLPIIFVVTVVGCLTHHFFLFFAGALSACFCIYYIINKQYKHFAIYAVTLLASVLVSILVFPATINHIFGRRGHIIKFPMEWQLKLSLNCIIRELTGIHIKVGKTSNSVIILCIIASLLIVSLLFAFVFRNDNWFRNMIHNLIQKSKNTINKIKKMLVNGNGFCVFIFVPSLTMWLAVAMLISLYVMGDHADRYLFIIYPSVCVLIVAFLHIFSSIITNNDCIANRVVLGICSLFVVSSNLFYPCIYLWTGDYSVRKLYDDSDIIYLTDRYDTLVSLAPLVLNANNVYMNSPFKFMVDKDAAEYINDNNHVYLLIQDSYLVDKDKNNENSDEINDWSEMMFASENVKSYNKKDFEQKVKKFNPYNICEYIGKDSIDGFKVSVYKLR